MKLEILKFAPLCANETIEFKIDGEVVSQVIVSRQLTDTTSETSNGIFQSKSTFYRPNSTSVTVNFETVVDTSQPSQHIAAELVSRGLKVKQAFIDKYPAKYDYGSVEF
jgi:hypothetical protein